MFVFGSLLLSSLSLCKNTWFQQVLPYTTWNRNLFETHPMLEILLDIYNIHKIHYFIKIHENIKLRWTSRFEIMYNILLLCLYATINASNITLCTSRSKRPFMIPVWNLTKSIQWQTNMLFCKQTKMLFYKQTCYFCIYVKQNF